ncbi:hypothetical protein TNCV_4391281 [Trichonephila clavipes]|nr:hypothetical protein TNCV_4391281 [Trichonephila clavipes]
MGEKEALRWENNWWERSPNRCYYKQIDDFYGNTIRANSLNVNEMRQAVWAVWAHTSSKMMSRNIGFAQKAKIACYSPKLIGSGINVTKIAAFIAACEYNDGRSYDPLRGRKGPEKSSGPAFKANQITSKRIRYGFTTVQSITLIGAQEHNLAGHKVR